MPTPEPKETKDHYISRCMSEVVGEGKEPAQAYAICQSKWLSHSTQKYAGQKISIDYDGTLSTAKGKELVKRLISEGKTVYIISARSDKSGMETTANELGIPLSRIFATGSNPEKIKKIKELGTFHYDNNQDVINQITGKLFR